MALGHKGIAETLSMSAAEFAFWADYAAREGLPADRLEVTAANGAAYGCLAANPRSRVTPEDVRPQTARRSARRLAQEWKAFAAARAANRGKQKTRGD